MSPYADTLKQNNIFPLSKLKRTFLCPTVRGAEVIPNADEEFMQVQMGLWWCGIVFFTIISPDVKFTDGNQTDVLISSVQS